jgi:hypothetical protein
MFIDFTTFTKYFFYLFVCYHYAKHHYPEKTQDFIIFVGYNSVYFYSKLQIILNKSLVKGHNYLIQYEKYQQFLSFLQKMKDELDIVREHVLLQSVFASFNFNANSRSNPKDITLDFIVDNKIEFTFEKTEFLRDYLTDFFPKNSNTNENETTEDETKQYCVIDYDFIIVYGEENLKKIIKTIDINELKQNTINSSIFKIEPFLYKPVLCEFKNGDGDDDKAIKIDFSDNNKFYDFLVVDNCFDKTFLTFFMKKYYEVDVNDNNYILKILDNNVNTLLFESTDVVKIENNCICKISK